MRVKLKLVNHGLHGHHRWWIVAQPIKKKLEGKYLEHLGKWHPIKRKVAQRAIFLNQHRVRYWLSVGAEPTPGVQRLLHRFDFCPKAPAPFGSTHVYQRPERTYGMMHFKDFARVAGSPNAIALYYRQRLQEQMNIVERKRRLAAEAIANSKAASTPYESQAAEDTDGQESDDPDVFSRKETFDKLLKKFQDHRKQKGLLLKGNDLRSNIYLRKMQKMARGELGLDILGYKDYVNNLKQFAHVNSDLQILSMDGMFKNPKVPKSLIEMEAGAFNDGTTGNERVQKHSGSVSLALAKILRKHSGHLNARDEAALTDLCENFTEYVTRSHTILDQVNRLYRIRKLERADLDDFSMLSQQILTASNELLEEAGVSGRQFEQIKMLLKIDPHIFTPEFKRHAKFYTRANIYDQFVDFTKLPANLSKDAKSLLYRPQKMKQLAECYISLARKVKSHAQRKIDRRNTQFVTRTVQIGHEYRVIAKQDSEIKLIDMVYDKIESVLKQPVDPKLIQKKLDPKVKVDTKGNENWNEMLLEKLLRERRQIPKEERLQRFRNDSVDEVDTTDLENWCLLEPKKRKSVDDMFQQMDEEADDNSLDMYNLKNSEHQQQLDENEMVESEEEYDDDETLDKDLQDWTKEALLRHRIDLAKMYLGKDGGYSLRKFKRIFKREMAEHPEKYAFQNRGAELIEEDDQPEDAQDEADSETIVEAIAEEEIHTDEEDDEKEEPIPEIDYEAEKLKLREQTKKEIDEMNADSEDEHYTFNEDELEALLEEVEKTSFMNEEEAEAFLEAQHQKIMSKRYKPNTKLKQRKEMKESFKTKDVYESMTSEPHPVSSLYDEAFFLDEKSVKQFFTDIEHSIGRYPNGFRHYENYANYSIVNPNSEISEYISEMNRQVEFQEFLAIMRQAATEESETPGFQFENSQEKLKTDDPTIQELIESELFERDCREVYQQKTQEALVQGKWFTLVDALDDTLDMWHYGNNMYKIPEHNIYIPVKHTIMKKPVLNDQDDIGFRYGATSDGLAIDPVAQINPLKSFKMGPEMAVRRQPTEPMGVKFNKFRRLSKVHRHFSTTIPYTYSSVDNVFAIRKYFPNL